MKLVEVAKIIPINEIIAMIFLGVASWMDVKKRKISIVFLAAFGIGAVVCGMIQQSYEMPFAALSLLPGFLLLCMSKATREAMGYGDGLAVLVLGLYVGLWATTEIVLTALLLAAICAGILLFGSKKGRKTEMPFLPFLFVGMLGTMFWK